jgi:hypothetical protein
MQCSMKSHPFGLCQALGVHVAKFGMSIFAIFTSAMLRIMPRILMKCGSKHGFQDKRNHNFEHVSLCSLLCSLLLTHPITSCYPKLRNFRGIQLRRMIIPVSFWKWCSKSVPPLLLVTSPFFDVKEHKHPQNSLKFMMIHVTLNYTKFTSPKWAHCFNGLDIFNRCPWIVFPVCSFDQKTHRV